MSRHHPTSTPRLAVIVFLQMLPAILVVASIRPLFATWHGGDDGAMHAFMSLNMLGAIVAAPLVGAFLDRRGGGRVMLTALAGADALLLLACAGPWPVAVVLALRTVEGAALVGALTVLMSEAARRGRRGDPRAVAATGAAIMAAIAAGSLAGAPLSAWPRGAFVVAALVSVAVAVYGARHLSTAPVVAPRACGVVASELRRLVLPAGAMLVGRFAVGCTVVTFALLAHHAHQLDDASIGLLFACLTVPFALATYPAISLAARVPRALVLASGTALAGSGLVLLALVPAPALAPTMIVVGLGSAAIFGAALGYAAERSGSRATAMAVLNAAGCLGMLLGPPAAGVTTALIRRSTDPVTGYRAGLVLGGAALLVWLVVNQRALRTLARREASGAAVEADQRLRETPSVGNASSTGSRRGISPTPSTPVTPSASSVARAVDAAEMTIDD